MIDSVAGAIVSARPQAITTIRQASCGYDVSADTNDMSSSPNVVRAMPAATTSLVPKRCTKRGDSGATIIIGSAMASSRTPACSGEYPSTNCRYWV